MVNKLLLSSQLTKGSAVRVEPGHRKGWSQKMMLLREGGGGIQQKRTLRKTVSALSVKKIIFFGCLPNM